MYKNILEETRKYLKSMGKTEHHLETDEMNQQMFDQLQDLRQEINEAKVKAMRDVAAQFDEKLNEIEELYSSMLRLIV